MFAPSNRIRPGFSTLTRQQFALALADYVALDGAQSGFLVEAIARLCVEAHTLHMPPEDLVAFVRETWIAMPGHSVRDRFMGDSHAKSLVYYRIVGACLRAYYA
jgi:hypothetical protein